MFSGIVETIGVILAITNNHDCKHFTIAPDICFDDLQIGDSISVNGVCLTVTAFTEKNFNVTLVPETLRLTNLNDLNIGDHVNLERSLKVTARIGGHYVQGHIDCVGHIVAIEKDQQSDALMVKISIPKPFTKYVIKKGYIGLDGMSITVIDTSHDWFTVTFIPHTQKTSIVKHYQLKSSINIEVDMVGKYIEKILGAYTCHTQNE